MKLKYKQFYYFALYTMRTMCLCEKILHIIALQYLLVYWNSRKNIESKNILYSKGRPWNINDYLRHVLAKEGYFKDILQWEVAEINVTEYIIHLSCFFY